jgi:hypothetical protein
VKYTRAGGGNIGQLDWDFELSTTVCLVKQHIKAGHGALGYKRSIQATHICIFHRRISILINKGIVEVLETLTRYSLYINYAMSGLFSIIFRGTGAFDNCT